MAFKATEIADCLVLSKKFERGAMYSSNEESVYAMMGPVLDTIRVQSGSFTEQLDNSENLSTPIGEQEKEDNLSDVLGNQSVSYITSNLTTSDDQEPDFGQKVAGNFGLLNEQGNFDAGAIFDSKCIPCGLRIDNPDVLFTKIGTGFLGVLSEYLQFMEDLLKRQLQQLQDMLGLFTNTDPYIDLCAFVKFFTDFMCVPDIARILSALMALMQKTSFEFGGVFDLILQFVGPLISPFLGNIVNLIQHYLMLVIKPLECIIDSVQALLAKFDYNVLFSNIDKLDKHIDLGGPKQGANLPGNEDANRAARRDDPRGDFIYRLDKPRLSPDEPKMPWIDGHIPRRDIVESDRFLETDFNMAGPLSTAIKGVNQDDQKAIEKAEQELRDVRKAGRKVDGTNAGAINTQREKERNAEKKYRAAVEKRSLSFIGRTNLQIDRGVAGLKSSLIVLIGYLREATAVVQSFFDFIFEEFKKLMGEYVGGTDNFIGQLIQKLALSQMIGIINQIMKSIQRGAVCPEDVTDLKVEDWLADTQGLTIWSDVEGNVHIQGDDQEISNAVDELIKAAGVSKPGEENNHNKLKGLIEFTGDSTLDMEIARMTEQLTTPINTIFKCPLQTSVAQTEQINEWIKQVNG